MRPHERIEEKTRQMETAIYTSLDSIDEYLETLRELIAEQESSDDPNVMLVKRMRQFVERGERMTAIVEDDVLAQLMFCLDRLFSVKMAEDGEFI